MPRNEKLVELVQHPDYGKLPAADRISAFADLDDDFRGLAPEEQRQFVGMMEGKFRAPKVPGTETLGPIPGTDKLGPPPNAATFGGAKVEEIGGGTFAGELKDATLGAVKRGAANVVSGLGGAVRYVGRNDSDRTLEEIGKGLQKFGEAKGQSPRYLELARERADWYTDPALLTNLVSEGVGSSAPFLAAGLATGGAAAAALPTAAWQTAARWAAGSATGALLESAVDAGDAYNEAIAKGHSPEKAAELFRETMRLQVPVTMATNALGEFLPTPKGSMLRKLGHRAVQAGVEGIEEPAQGAVQRYARNATLGENTPLLEGAGQEFVGGLGGGAVLGGIRAAAGEMAERIGPRPEAAPETDQPSMVARPEDNAIAEARAEASPEIEAARQKIITAQPAAFEAGRRAQPEDANPFPERSPEAVAFEAGRESELSAISDQPSATEVAPQLENANDATQAPQAVEPGGVPLPALPESSDHGVPADNSATAKSPVLAMPPNDGDPAGEAAAEAAVADPLSADSFQRAGQAAAAAGLPLKEAWQAHALPLYNGSKAVPAKQLGEAKLAFLRGFGPQPKSAQASGVREQPLGQAGTAIADNMHAMLWDKVQRGETLEGGKPSALLQVAKMARDAGGLSTPEQMRALSGDYASIRSSGKERQADLRTLVTKYSTNAAQESQSGMDTAKREYASTQVAMPAPIAKRVQEAGARIPDAVLGEKGRETDPHVTVKYGLHDGDPEKVRALVEGAGPIKVKLGKASLFENEDADVLKVDVESEDLNRLNKLIAAALPNTETHGAYKPHVTIAYLKPGEGKKYAGKLVPGVSGKEITLDTITFSDQTGKKTEIRLGEASGIRGQGPGKQATGDGEAKGRNQETGTRSQEEMDAKALEAKHPIAFTLGRDPRAKNPYKPNTSKWQAFQAARESSPPLQARKLKGQPFEESALKDFDLERIAPDMDFELIPAKGDRPAQIRTNWQGMAVIDELLGNDGRSQGIAISRAEYQATSKRMSRLTDGRMLTSEATTALRRFASGLDQASQQSPQAFIITDVGPGVDSITRDRVNREERTHVAQLEIGSGSIRGHINAKAFLRHPLAKQAAEVLVDIHGYAPEPDILAAEIGAKIAAGSWSSELSLTRAQAIELFAYYVKLVRLAHPKSWKKVLRWVHPALRKHFNDSARPSGRSKQRITAAQDQAGTSRGSSIGPRDTEADPRKRTAASSRETEPREDRKGQRAAEAGLYFSNNNAGEAGGDGQEGDRGAPGAGRQEGRQESGRRSGESPVDTGKAGTNPRKSAPAPGRETSGQEGRTTGRQESRQGGAEAAVGVPTNAETETADRAGRRAQRPGAGELPESRRRLRRGREEGARGGIRPAVSAGSVSRRGGAPRLSLQSRRPAAPFFSQLERTLEAKMPGRATPAQIRAILSNPQNAVKPDEIQWTGLDEFLAQAKAPLTKAEVLAFVRANAVRVDEVAVEKPKYEAWSFGGGKNYTELLFTLPGGDKPRYSSQHWPNHPNVLAHARFSEQTAYKPASGGTRTFHVEEIQSDWHQAGRKHGYGKKPGGQGWLVEGLAVPDAPFAKTWHELVFRRMVRLAAENGYDRLTWPTGAQQAERFDLSKTVDTIAWDRKTGYFEAFQEERSVISQSGVAPDDLEPLVGKEIAQKLLNAPDDKAGPVEIEVGESTIGGEGMAGFYDGILPSYADKLGKKFGAKTENVRLAVLTPIGAKDNWDIEDAAFETVADALSLNYEWNEGRIAPPDFDSIPNKVEDFTKDLETLGIEFEDTEDEPLFGSRPYTYERSLYNKLAAAVKDRYDEAYQEEVAANTETEIVSVHSLPITEAMRESVLEGQPLFSAAKPQENAGDAKPLTPETVKAAFPGGEIAAATFDNGQPGWLVYMPNGTRIAVMENAEIAVDPALYERTYGQPYGGEVGLGSFTRIGRDGIIRLAKTDPAGTLSHEAFHAAMQLALSPAERERVIRRHGSEEKAAKAYEQWDGTKHTLFGKVRDFFSRIAQAFGFDQSFAKIASGRVWSAPSNAERGAVSPELTGAALIVRGVRKMNEWRKAMIEAHGEGVRPKLSSLWLQLRPLWRNDNGAVDLGGLARALENTTIYATGDWLISSMRTRLAHEGKGAGRKIDELLHRTKKLGEVEAGRASWDLLQSGLMELTREEAFDLMDAMEGRAKADLDPKVAAAQQQVTSVFDNLANTAVALGMKIKRNGKWLPFHKRKDWYPHVFPSNDELSSGPVREDVAANMVRTGFSADKAAAYKAIDSYTAFMGGGNRPGFLIEEMMRANPEFGPGDAMLYLQQFRENIRRHGSLEHSREMQIALPLHDPDPRRVLPVAAASAARRLSEVAHLGQNDERLLNEIADIIMAGGNGDLVTKWADSILGRIRQADDKESQAVQFLTGIHVLKLGLAAAQNLGQMANTWISTDTATFWGTVASAAYSKANRDAMRRTATQSGATLDPVLHEMHDYKHAGKVETAGRALLKYTGFTTVERWNRVIAAETGRRWALKLHGAAKRGDQQAAAMLQELGVDPKKDALNATDELVAASTLVDMAQFRSRPEDFPTWASTPIGKLLFQFKGFAYNQTRFLLNETLGELRAGRWDRGMRNLMIFAAVFPLWGELVRALKDAILGRDEKKFESLLERWYYDIVTGGTLGLAGDYLEASRQGRLRLFSTLAGPTAGLAVDTASAMAALPDEKKRGKTAVAWFKAHAPLGRVIASVAKRMAEAE